MRSVNSYLHRSGISLIVVAMSLHSAAAYAAAAEAEVDSEIGLSEIVVTAQKRSENLQDTPIAISVLNDEGLKDRNVISLLDLGDGAIPSLKVAPFYSRPGALIVNIRGVGVLSDSNQPARDQGVGVYIDGVYLGRAQGLGAALFDVSSIEVLKGPQGTLFGRNTIGGAVNIVTRKPTGEFGLDASANIGNFGSHNAEVHLNLPSIAGVALKFDGVLARRDPFVKNPLEGASGFNSYDKRGFVISARWQPTEDFTADLAYDNSYDASTPLYQQQITAPAGLPAQSSGSPAVLANVVSPLFQVRPNRVKSALIGIPMDPSIGKATGYRMGLEYELSQAFRIRSITSYREMSQGQYDNSGPDVGLQKSGSANFTGFRFGRISNADFKQDQISQELQFIGELPRLKYQFGALYYRENVDDSAYSSRTFQFTDAAGTAYTYATTNGIPNVFQLSSIPKDRASTVETTSIGAYGQVTWNPIDVAHLTLGARWTRDKKQGELHTINGALPVVNGVAAPLLLDASWSRLDPLVNLAFDVTSDIMAYAKWSTGYRSGGASSRSLTFERFEPEKVSMFELGLKSELLDRRLRLNLAAYYGTYKDIQLDYNAVYTSTRTTTEVTNAPGNGKLKGVEAELAVAPLEGLTLSASYAYNSVKIPDSANPFPQTFNGPIDNTKFPTYQPYTPEHSASATIDYNVPVSGNGTYLKFHLDGNFDSGYYTGYADSNYDSVTKAVLYKQPKGDKALVFNSRIALADIPVSDNGAKLTVSFWGRNIFNKEYFFFKNASNNFQYGSNAAAGEYGFMNDPRTFGFELNLKM